MTFPVIPSEWNSAWRPVRYEIAFDSPDFKQTTTSITDDSGNAELNFSTALFTKFIVGNKVYIESGVYLGEHEILTVTSQTQITIDTPYLSNATVSVINMVVPLVKVYKGYTSVEAYFVELPITLIAEFTPEINPDYRIAFDLSGYLQSIFTIVPPVGGIDFNMFNQFRVNLFYEAAINNVGIDITIPTNPFKVLNAAIDTDTLNANFVNTGRYLTPNYPAIIFNCGKTVLSYIMDEFVVNEVLEGEPVNSGDFNNDFSNDFYIE